MTQTARVVVIGAGVGGLSAAAVLAKNGLDVTVLEAHIDPGGCAGTFFHRGYHFDAGATVAGGFYPGGPMDLLAAQAGVATWPACAADSAMSVHLPQGAPVVRWTDPKRWREERIARFGEQGEDFWAWQEAAADAMWALALRIPPWPPQGLDEWRRLACAAAGWTSHASLRKVFPELLGDAFLPVARRLPPNNDTLKLFVDAQLLISAQTTSAHANALYGASALDLPRRGVVHLAGGMAAIAETLTAAVRRHGGHVLMRREVTRIARQTDGAWRVETAGGDSYPADALIANLTPWNIAALLGDTAPAKLRRLPSRTASGWGAFVAYIGMDEAILPAETPLHHQVVVAEPLGEGNSVFVSLSPPWDASRAPAGHRAVTISTHTALAPWWQLFEQDREAYEQRKQRYLDKLLTAAERALPGLHQAADVVMPGTPVTFARFTGRASGWVGGFAQTNLFQSWAPRLEAGLWMAGDSIFPGQSTAAVALGGLRVAQSVLHNARRSS